MGNLLSAVAAGIRIVDLGHPLDEKVPRSGWSPGFSLERVATHLEDVRDDGLSVCNDRLVMGTHVGTHADALGHVACGGELHGSVPVDSPEGRWLDPPLDAGSIPAIACRGVLLDIPRTHGLDTLEPGQAVTADDLHAAAGSVNLCTGDVVLIRTGWGRNWQEAGRFFDATRGIPGITLEAAAWLADRGVSMVGADTPGVEHIDPVVRFRTLPVHRLLLVDKAVHLLEAVDLEELSSLEVQEFIFIIAPLRLRGASGVPVRPLALIEAP